MDILEIFPKNLDEQMQESIEQLISENNLPFAWEESFDGGMGCFKVYSFGRYPLEELKLKCEDNFPNCDYTWKEMDSESWSSGWTEEEVTAWESRSFKVFIGKEHIGKKNHGTIVLERSPHVFGDGQHTSTTLMLDAMEVAVKERMPVRALDFGAGSGILAIGAEKLSIPCVHACEIDADALKVAEINCKNNDCPSIKLYQYLPESLNYDFIMCNVQPPLLNSLLPDLNRRLDTNGTMILSGYTTLDKRGIEVLMEKIGFKNIVNYENKGWLATVWNRS